MTTLTRLFIYGDCFVAYFIVLFCYLISSFWLSFSPFGVMDADGLINDDGGGGRSSTFSHGFHPFTVTCVSPFDYGSVVHLQHGKGEKGKDRGNAKLVKSDSSSWKASTSHCGFPLRLHFSWTGSSIARQSAWRTWTVRSVWGPHRSNGPQKSGTVEDRDSIFHTPNM